MKSVLLIGLGRYGYNVSVKLHDLGHDVLAIDKSEKRVNAALPVVTDAQIGDATDLDLLKSLGVKNFEVCIVAIGNDFQSSLEITSLLKELGAPLVVARASSDLQEKLLKKNRRGRSRVPRKATRRLDGYKVYFRPRYRLYRNRQRPFDIRSYRSRRVEG